MLWVRAGNRLEENTERRLRSNGGENEMLGNSKLGEGGCTGFCALPQKQKKFLLGRGKGDREVWFFNETIFN